MPSATAGGMAAAPAAQPVLPDELLEDVFLRLDDAADLARASSSCTAFRRVVSARRFLRRFGSLHPPPVLGFLDCTGSSRGFYQSQPPRRSAAAARALSQAADFTFSFLPDPASWRVRDARDGRVLLGRRTATWSIFEDLVVCDPLHRRCVQTPPIRGDLADSIWQPGIQHFEPFLAPAGNDEEESSLQVICNVLSETKIATIVFSSVSGRWRGVTSFSTVSYEWLKYPILLDRHCVHSCFYWTGYHSQAMLVLGTLDMKFSVVDLLPGSGGREKTVVDAGEGRLGLLILGDRSFDLYSKTWPENGVGAEEWLHDKIIPLPQLPNCNWHIGDSSEGCLLLRGIPRGQVRFWHQSESTSRKNPDAQYFTLELKTSMFERFCVLKFETSPDYLYASFPPSFSLPSI